MVLLVLFLFVIFVVYVASFNNSRSKGPNAAVMVQLSGLRAQAENYSDVNGYSYSGLCAAKEIDGFEPFYQELRNQKRGRLCAIPTSEIQCEDSESAYAISARLPNIMPNEGQKYYCVDSTDFHGTIDTPITGTSCK